nr:MAG TPA: hypothetical protein [Caudoviricetes sp.]
MRKYVLTNNANAHIIILKITQMRKLKIKEV